MDILETICDWLTLEPPVTLPTETHAAYPLGLSAEIGVELVGGFI